MWELVTLEVVAIQVVWCNNIFYFPCCDMIFGADLDVSSGVFWGLFCFWGFGGCCKERCLLCLGGQHWCRVLTKLPVMPLAGGGLWDWTDSLSLISYIGITWQHSLYISGYTDHKMGRRCHLIHHTGSDARGLQGLWAIIILSNLRIHLPSVDWDTV